MPMLVKLEGYTVYEVSYRGVVVIGLRNIAAVVLAIFRPDGC